MEQAAAVCCVLCCWLMLVGMPLYAVHRVESERYGRAAAWQGPISRPGTLTAWGAEAPRLALGLLHGFGANAFSWSFVDRRLAARLHALVTAHDMPGFGLTQRCAAGPAAAQAPA